MKLGVANSAAAGNADGHLTVREMEIWHHKAKYGGVFLGDASSRPPCAGGAG